MNLKLVKKITTIVLLSTTFIITSNAVMKTNAKILFKNISLEDGLSQATVETIIQDSKGYIWIGTNDGLNRYNGYDFQVYRKEKDSDKSLTNNYITKLVEDAEANIWASTLGGVNKINGDEITHYISDPNKGNLSNNTVTDILVTNDGKILISTYDGINIYDEENDMFYPFLKDNSILKSKVIFSLEEDNLGNIWVGTEEGIDKVNSRGEIVRDFIYDDAFKELTNKSVRRILCEDNGEVWICTYNSGLKKIDMKNATIKEYINDKNNPSSLPSNYVRNILRDRDDNLWLCTANGLARYLPETDNFSTVINSAYNKDSLINDETFVAYQDNSGLIWVGTYSGISIFDPSSKIKTYKKEVNSDYNTLSENAIHGIYKDDNNFLWVGTNSKGVNVINEDTNEIRYVNSETVNGFSNNSINVISGYDEYIYIGTNNGLNIINTETNNLKVINVEDGLVDKFVKNIMVDSRGYVWIGTTQGFNIYNPKNQSMINLNPYLKESNIRDFYSSAIFEDSSGVYWIGTFYNGGLIKIDPYKKEIKNYLYDEENPNSISDDVIRTITEDALGNLWIGTRLGLNKFNKTTESFESFTTKDGLSNNYIYGILIDEDNNPWMSTNSGISKYDVNDNKFINLDVTDGLQSNEFNGGAYFKSKSGEFYFGGIGGLNSFYPHELINSSYSPNLQFDEFKLNGRAIGKVDGEKFNYNENTITIKVFLPDYRNSKNIQYYYQISTAEEWYEIENNEITLSNLSSGQYKIKFKARNTNGSITDESELNFTIKPPFWRSGFAFILYLLIIIGFYFRGKYKVRVLDIQVKERTRALSEEMKINSDLLNKVIQLERRKNNYFVNLSHELRTPLNVLSSTQQLITKLNNSEEGIDKEKLNHYMDVVKRNIHRLLTIINDLIDSSKIESGNYKLNLKKHNIVYIVEEAALTLKDYSKLNGSDLIIDPEIEEKFILCDDSEIERCIINLVSNSIKHTPSHGSITVSIRDLQDSVRIDVSDTGEGIPEEYHETIFNRFNQVIDKNPEVKNGSGLGLTITKQIVDLHGGEIFLESKAGNGCTFTIILPVTIN